MPTLIGILVVLSLAESVSAFPARFCDFRAFYCGGRTVLVHQDAYREHPLHECEHALPGPFLSDLPDEITIPAPYPGYVLELFSIVARLSFDNAVISWTLCSCAALGIAFVMVSRLTATPLVATAIVLGLPAAVIPLPLGQPTLFVLLALACAAMLLHAGRPRCAAVAALITFLDPQIGLAVCLGLFVAVQRTRLTLLIGIGVLEAISLAAFGPARELEYVLEVLPAHALVNVPEFSQFSTANLAFTAGLAPKLALMLGHIWYAAAVAIGVVAGVRLRLQFGLSAVIFVPLAFAVFGGSHTHLQQLELALPAFLLITSAASGTRRNRLVVITFAASVPWLISAAQPTQFLAIAALGVAFARLMGTPRISLSLGAGSLIVLLALCAAVIVSPASYERVQATTQSGNPLAEVSWGRFVDATSIPPRAWHILGKVPTLLAFLSGFTFLIKAAQLPPAESLPVERESGRAVGRYAL